jgi:peptidyl-prolyl cis-trans isomerase A (cyclophilin A)
MSEEMGGWLGLLQSRQRFLWIADVSQGLLVLERRVMLKAKIAVGLVVVGVATTGFAQARAGVRHAGAAKVVEPAGPTVVIDTSMGRITCKLYEKQAPVTVANFVGLAEGSKDWKDPATDQMVHGKGFYDGTGLAGISDGILGGDRLGRLLGTAGTPFPMEKSGLGFERAGRLVMAKYKPQPGEAVPVGKVPDLESSSVFYVLEHADKEYEGRGTVFGQCDDASLPVVTAISHALLSTDNHPSEAIAINHVAVVREGEAMPVVAVNVPLAKVTPHPVPTPFAAIPSPEPTGPTAVIETSMGTLTCRLFDKEAPIGVANFVGLAEGSKEWKNPATHVVMRGKKFYDGLSFRRVIPDFMIQNADLPGDTSGDGDIGFHFANEIVPGLNFDRPGRLAYANAGPDTNESEFFITEVPNHRLDGNYTIFGQCDEASVKLEAAIARVPRDEKNRPLKAVVIRRITFEGGGESR